MSDFFKDFILGFFVLGISFVLPYALYVYWWGGSHDTALFVGWISCSLITAWLFGAGGGSDGS